MGLVHSPIVKAKRTGIGTRRDPYVPLKAAYRNSGMIPLQEGVADAEDGLQSCTR
jgi:hypothetical protein